MPFATSPVIAQSIPLEELSPRKDCNGFLQTAFWARQKEAFGWKALAVRFKQGEKQGTLLVLIKSLPAGLSLAYVPSGPDSAWGQDDREEFLAALSGELRGILPLGCFFIRWDLPEFSTNGNPPYRYADLLKKAPLDIQPPDTFVLDLKPGYQGILEGMHKKTRYNIGLAGKKGIKVETAGAEKLNKWYELYQLTAKRDNIGIHPLSYYEALFQNRNSSQQGVRLVLYLAWHQEDLLAGMIVLYHGREAVYLYGASSNDKREFMPAYALQARAIQDACEAGCVEYDLYGCPPFEDPGHPMAGLYRFKAGFGGELRHRPGAWDFPYSRLFYNLYRGLESLRCWYYKSWKKRR